jgi:hypothetical protein
MALVSTELRMGLRSRFFRLACVLMAALGFPIGQGEGPGTAMAAWATGESACQYLAIAAAIWCGYGALRDTASRADVIILTKPQPLERLALARYVGLYGQVLLVAACLFAGAVVGRLTTGGSPTGLGAFVLQYGRAAAVLFFATASSFGLALLGGSPIAGGLIGLVMVAAMGGKAFLPKLAIPWYTQNLGGFAAIGALILGLALWFSRKSLRGDRPAAIPIRMAVPIAAAAAVLSFANLLRTGHDPMVHEDQGLVRMSQQTVAAGTRAPGFLLPGNDNRAVSLSERYGKVLVVALFSPSDADSGILLTELERVRKEYGAKGVEPVAICLSEDSGAPATFAAGESLGFPVVHDWGTHNAPESTERSPMAQAYLADRLPKVVITDRRHRVRAQLDGTQAYSSTNLDEFVGKRLEEEPE